LGDKVSACVCAFSIAIEGERQPCHGQFDPMGSLATSAIPRGSRREDRPSIRKRRQVMQPMAGLDSVCARRDSDDRPFRRKLGQFGWFRSCRTPPRARWRPASARPLVVRQLQNLDNGANDAHRKRQTRCGAGNRLARLGIKRQRQDHRAAGEDHRRAPSAKHRLRTLQRQVQQVRSL